MKKDLIVALEIGSSKLKVVVAKEGVNDTFNLVDFAEREYDGYYQGEFVEQAKLESELETLFDSIDYIKKKYYKKVFVGVPAEFVGVEVVNVTLNFEDSQRITKRDVEDLYISASEKIQTDGVEILSASAISFSLDDGGKIIGCPVGKKARQLSAEVSVVVAEKANIQKLNDIFANLGFISVEYISESLCATLEVIPKEEREHECLLVDVGHLSTSVAIAKGEGLISLTSYSIGGGYITSDLCERFDLTYENADKLKKQIVMSVKGERGDGYDLVTEAGVKRINLQDANNVVINRVDSIGRAINQCVQNYTMEYIQYLPVYLVGAGLTKLKGGKDYLSKCIGRNIELGVPDLPGKDKPENAVLFGILNYAVKNL